MKRKVIIVLLLVAIAAFICIPLLKNNTTETIEMATFKTPYDNIQVAFGKELPLAFYAPEGLTKLELYYSDSLLQTFNAPSGKEFTYRLASDYYGVGTRAAVLRSYYPDGTFQNNVLNVRVVSDIAPVNMISKMIQTLPHDTQNYTQGLEFSDGKLYESTGDPGQAGKTTLGIVDMASGTFSSLKNGLDATYFGEGITILGNTLYQLTWKNGMCFTYDKNNMILKKETFTYSGEGWGLCNNGKEIIMSDGSEYITFRDPSNFRVLRTIQVYDNVQARTNLNELEYINGKIYANVWQTNTIIAIDPATGKVLEQIDATELEILGKNNGDVLNGIAYNPATKKTYVTGKYWSKLFEVNFVNE